MNESLQRTLKKLRLSGMIQSLDVRLQEAAGNNLNHGEFLELILQDELLVRAERLMQRRVKAAAFREPKTLEDFDWQFNTSVKRKQIYDLATCQFIEKGIDVLFLGPPGHRQEPSGPGNRLSGHQVRINRTVPLDLRCGA